MKTFTYVFIGLVLIISVGFGLLFFIGNSSNQPARSLNPSANSEFSKRYVAYSEENLLKATQNNGKAVVFFHADWCPTCIAAEADFRENFDNLPKDVIILKTNYDTSTALKQKYSVVYQDTFVQIDSRGDEITKWVSGGQGVNALLANIK